ncbi:MAG: FAD-dependent oxidoreductase [Pseudoscardovia radai]|nr:FAD-dependent oxidoreductase [Pseudoscardovia radai]
MSIVPPVSSLPSLSADSPVFDVAVIGAGPGGYSCALRAAQLGLRVALVERDARPGGTCLNRGCIPTKALLTAAHAADEARRGETMGIMLPQPQVDYDRLAAFRDTSVDTMVTGLESLLSRRGVTLVRGTARLDGDTTHDDAAHDGTAHDVATATDGATDGARHRVIVDTSDGTTTLAARAVVLATGARPTQLDALPFGSRVLDSDHALTLDHVPSSVIIVGSGAIGLEFASFWSSLGAQVTVLLRHGRPLSAWPRRVGMAVRRGMGAHGVQWDDYESIEAYEDVDGGIALTLSGRGGATSRLEAELCLVAVGRTPISAPWVSDSGIETDARGFVVTDPWGRTSRPGVFAVGDVTRGRQTAHRAFEQGIVAAECIAGLEPAPVEDAASPLVVFSSPEAASVGLAADEARANGAWTDVRDTAIVTQGNARVMMSGASGVIDLVTATPADGGERIVLGAHMAGPHVSELVAEAEQLVRGRVPLSQAARAIHPHPTFGEALGEALLAADGRPLHTF